MAGRLCIFAGPLGRPDTFVQAQHEPVNRMSRSMRTHACEACTVAEQLSEAEGCSLDRLGGHQLIVLGDRVFGHKGVGAQASVIGKIQQRQHHPLVLLRHVGEDKGVRCCLRQHQSIMCMSHVSVATKPSL